MTKNGIVYQPRLPEIRRTLVSYAKEDGTQGIVVLWDAAFFGSETSAEVGDVTYLSNKDKQVGFEISSEEDGQCVRAWPLS